MTDAERLELMTAECSRLNGEVELWRARAAQWEEQAERMTKMKLEADRDVYAAEQSEARMQERLDNLQQAYNNLSDEIITDWDKFLKGVIDE